MAGGCSSCRSPSRSHAGLQPLCVAVSGTGAENQSNCGNAVCQGKPQVFRSRQDTQRMTCCKLSIVGRVRSCERAWFAESGIKKCLRQWVCEASDVKVESADAPTPKGCLALQEQRHVAAEDFIASEPQASCASSCICGAGPLMDAADLQLCVWVQCLRL